MSITPSTTQREAGSSKSARRRTGRRLSANHVLIAVVVILAFVLNLLVLQDRSSSQLVAIADRPLTTGTPLTDDSIRLVPVDSSFEGLPSLVSEGDLPVLEGWVVGRAIPEGGLIDRAALVEPGEASGLRSMSIPIATEHAAGGALVSGDRVDVISVGDGVASFVARDLEVTGVSESAGAAIGAASAYNVVVAVTADQALALAQAIDSGSMEIVRSTGALGAGGQDGS